MVALVDQQHHITIAMVVCIVRSYFHSFHLEAGAGIVSSSTLFNKHRSTQKSERAFIDFLFCDSLVRGMLKRRKEWSVGMLMKKELHRWTFLPSPEHANAFHFHKFSPQKWIFSQFAFSFPRTGFYTHTIAIIERPLLPDFPTPTFLWFINLCWKSHDETRTKLTWFFIRFFDKLSVETLWFWFQFEDRKFW